MQSAVPFQRPTIALLRYGLLAGLALGSIHIVLNIGYRVIVPPVSALKTIPFFYDFVGRIFGNVLLWSIAFFVLGMIAARIFKQLEGVEAAVRTAPWASLSSGLLFVVYLFIFDVFVPHLLLAFTFSEIALMLGQVVIIWIMTTLLGIGLSALGGIVGS